VNLVEAQAWLDGHLNRELVPGGVADGDGLSLDAMRQLCHVLGDPQQACPAIHVTGTNGKGSVAAMASALLAAQGLTVGTYTSPHLHRINERMRRNGEPIGDDELAEVLAGVAAVEPLVEQPLSWFELVTAAALSWFAGVAVDVMVIEVGMLGRWDATNVVDAEVAVVTSVGFDHTDGTGDWEERVASEKAGIIVPGATAVLGRCSPRLRPVFELEEPARLWTLDDDVVVVDRRQAVGGQVATLITPLGAHEDVFVAAHGAHQADNAAVAIAAVEALFDRPLPHDVVAEAMGAISVEGRCTVVGHQPLVVVDGAHNPPAAQALAETLTTDFAVDGRRIAVVGMLADRDPSAFMAALDPLRIDAVVACTVVSPRALPAADIAATCAAHGLPVEIQSDPEQAVAMAVAAAGEDGMVVVTGSLYLAAAILNSPGATEGT